MAHPKFPTFAVIILIIGLFWLLQELGFINISIPWLPIILVVVAIGWIVNAYARK